MGVMVERDISNSSSACRVVISGFRSDVTVIQYEKLGLLRRGDDEPLRTAAVPNLDNVFQERDASRRGDLTLMCEYDRGSAARAVVDSGCGLNESVEV